MPDNTVVKAALTVLVLIVGSASLPFTAGTSSIGVIGAIFAIWGIDWSGK